MMPSTPPTISASDQRRGAELHRDRQPDAKEIGDGEIGKVVARPEIAVQQIVQIVEVLFPDRLIEVIDPLEIGLHRRV